MNSRRTYVSKYKGKRSYGKPRTRRVSRAPRVMKGGTGIISIQSETYAVVKQLVGQTVPTMNGTTYKTIAEMLMVGTSFQNLIGDYAKYKITALNLRFDSCLDTQQSAIIDNHSPPISFMFYPHRYQSDAGVGPLYSDTKGYFSTQAGIPQQQYTWKFKDGFFEASAGGYGTWNNTQTINSMVGQLSVCTSVPNLVPTADVKFGTLRITLTVQFSGKIL